MKYDIAKMCQMPAHPGPQEPLTCSTTTKGFILPKDPQGLVGQRVVSNMHWESAIRIHHYRGEWQLLTIKILTNNNNSSKNNNNNNKKNNMVNNNQNNKNQMAINSHYHGQ